ncbi:uncharacterized protein LOC108864161 [Galendromus occidentalis]|uniref:Uncharacterized protein LOC108864161 n=1 Tax=Galendromus occidentalis TaxID=34638 RepID=A0AAJ7P9G1_9ACAR|nr:uncharacterized protein LOC108864161 [Galendromus occidentalis]
MSTVEVLGALQKVKRYPSVTTITSDNGLSFHRAAKELKVLYAPHSRDLEVILSNIEAMINMRPITTVAAEVDQIEALSPADSLYGYKSKTFFPEHTLKASKRIDADKITFSRRWVYQQKVLNNFWKWFHKEYLRYLRSAHSRKPPPTRPLRVGDICLSEDHNPSRAYWPLCRVVALKGDAKPEHARSCTIKTATGQILDRPKRNLYPIESPKPN